jgi:L-fuculose-phosphate aldolase
MGIEYPTDVEARRDIVEVGRRLYQRGLVAANDGNISARVSDGALWATTSGVSKGFLTESDLVKLDLDGTVLEGGGRASSEIQMHLGIYRRAPTVTGVCHAHPPVATTFAAAGIPLDRALLQEAVLLLGVIPVAPYAPPGSAELAQGAAAYCPDYNGVLLEHHGAVAWGDSVLQALFRMESIEYNATVLLYARLLGLERPLDSGRIDELIALRPLWGIRGGGRPH